MKRHIFFLVALLLYAGSAWAQSRTIAGRILDEAGDGLPGAQVKVVGSNIGTVTDVDGNFSLTVPETATQITVSASGYGEQTLAVTDNLTAIRMVPTTRVLNETVVTALGIRREKKRLGYSQSDVNSEAIRRSGEQNAIQALAVKAPGVVVTQSSGTPGGSSKITMRGSNSFGFENQPLVVVDGIIIDNSTAQPTAGDYAFNQNLTGVNESNRAIDINPEDIENISVLRGPAAAALYGSRGGNGAIIITTKRGRYGTGRRLGVTVNSSVEISRVNKLPELQTQYLQGGGGVFTTFNPGDDGLVLTGDDVLGTPNSWGPRADTAGRPVFDKYDQFFETGMSYNNSVAIDGGTERNTFRLSIANLTSRGVIPNSKFDRTTVNLNAEQKVTDWLTVSGNANYTNSRGTRVQNGSNLGGVMLTLLRAPINYDVDNYYNDTTKQQTMYFGVYDNPKFSVFRNPYNDYTNRFFGNVFASAQVSRSTNISWRVGTDAYNTETRQVFDLSSAANDNGDGTGQVNRSSYNFRRLYSDLLVRFSKELSEKFELSGLVGHNLQYDENTFIFARGRNLQVADFYNLSNTSELYSSNNETYLRLHGLFAEASIGYASQLFMTVTGRNDWSTAFGQNSRGFFYAKADAAWVFSELFERSNAFSYGKIRVAYADAGGGPPTGYNAIRATYFTQPFITDGFTNGASFPYLSQSGLAPSNINFPGGLVPQHTIGREAGLELRFWRGRINFEGTYYSQLALDNIIQQPIAPSTGFQYQYINGGTIRNRGVEIGLNADVVKNKNLTVNLGGTFTLNRSKVLSLASGISEISIESGFTEPQSYAIVGQPYGVFYGSYWLRDDATGKLLVDSAGQPQRSVDSRKIGDPNPDWLAGLFGNVSYKGFTFGMLWDIRKGGDIWNGTWARLNRIGQAAPTADRERKYLVDGVYAPGTPKAGQQNTDSVTALYYFSTVVGDVGNFATENAIQDGGWVRLRQANIAYRYNFDRGRGEDASASESRSPFSYIELGVTGRNLLLFTDYTGVDPETSLTGASSNIGGWDYFNNPNTRSWIINLRFGL